MAELHTEGGCLYPGIMVEYPGTYRKGAKEMTDHEIRQFIAIMADVCIHYEPDEVRERYGHLSLKDAVFRRLQEGRQALAYLEDMVRTDLEAMKKE